MDDKLRRQASIEWFHALANHDRSEIARRCSPENLTRLQEHVARCLAGNPLPTELTPEQFAEVVLDLRANEGDWNRATMSAIVRADDLMLAGQTEEAVHVLHAFAASCPWVLFREVARNQASLFQDE